MTMEYYVGQRLSLKGQVCTVRYVGPVEGKAGDWLGVEWHDPARGKHNGTHEGKQYFKCRSSSSTAASFLRPSQQWDQTRTFYQALREKYMPEDAGTGGDIVYFSTKQAEEVGFEKFAKRQAALQGIKTIVLDHMCISCKALDSERDLIAETCKEIMDLDVGSNLFESLDEILSLLLLMPKLRSVVFDGNRLTVGETDHASLDRITTLSLSHNLLSWSEIASVTKTFPGTTKLAAAGNELASIGPDALPTSIQELDLSENAFLTLSDLAHLVSLPHLRTLTLKHNSIGLMKYDSGAGSLSTISNSVEDVDLAHNAIATWPLFNSLPIALPALRHLRVTGNPLYKDLHSAERKLLTAEDGYMLTMARLPQLETLNFSKITEKERLNADNYYLREIAAEVSLASEKQTAEILARHPRWTALCEEYGEPTISRAPKPDEVDPRSLAARLVTITFFLHDEDLLSGSVRSWVKEVPKSFNVYTLLGMVGKKLGISPLKLRLVSETGEKDPVGRNTGDGSVEWWDSDEDEAVVMTDGADLVSREVELVAGTRALGTYIEGREARVRVEAR
ncbi:Tubulin-specific chaperone E [Pseudocercospora fuligena]|uniref:Tubulin-specific chaperone E n=1 Tax=Pseudocercospora fuligena TaxID=685502 RepID=A0A8H6R4T3_9PEZI|nr:Tubulin-specific chaperone E [Pseudocercospora fuligena]